MSKISSWLEQAGRKLTAKDVPTARLDCLVLLEDLLGKDRAHLLAHPELELTNEQESVLNEQVARRAKHEPLAYIRGKSEFYGREFMVNAHTLEPRSETETMLTLLKKQTEEWRLRNEDNELTLVDVGTGSGAIAVTAKLEFPQARVIATDISQKCLETAQQNANNLNADVTFFLGNLVEPLLDPRSSVLGPLAILANLPYVPDSHTINKAAMFEPRLAIFGGADGLDLYRELFAQIDRQEHKPQHILTEALPFQHKDLALIAKSHGYTLAKTDDFIQLFKFSN
ncbi:peptide chain release factor N(5)-glutamine methyltransferase [Candidatus Saccharibacteria bacterium]|nr:peptide chain release factor N(5)-glutamine methyltransferase [Candidatus Saccharibacteria bacterium]